MNSGTIAYIILFFILWWGSQGYIIYLFYNRKKRKPYLEEKKEHFFSVIVPTFNEKEFISRKIESLKSLTYQRCEIIFSDASNDQTPELIRRQIEGDSRFSLLAAQTKGRSWQINSALARAKGDVIVISDCDGFMPADTLEKISGYLRDESVAVVGGCVLPAEANVTDKVYWQSQNTLRFLESDYGHCPAVSGVCYAFRRSLFDVLPWGVWSDDIYAPLLANTKGFSCVYAQEIVVFELRSPKNLRELIAHKTRKGQDFIKELLRFTPMILRMRPRWLVVFVTRCIQVIMLPWILVLFVVFWFYQSAAIQLYSLLIILISGLIQWNILRSRCGRDPAITFRRIFEIFSLMNLILVMAMIRYIFGGGRSAYKKIKQ